MSMSEEKKEQLRKLAKERYAKKKEAETVKIEDASPSVTSEPEKLSNFPVNFPVIEVEDVPFRDEILMVTGMPEGFAHRWVLENKIANGRHKYWQVMNREDPKFSEVRVRVDNTPDKSFIRCRDLILCVCRKETQNKAKENVQRRTEMSTKGFDRSVEATINQMGMIKGKKQMFAMKSVDEER